MSMRKRPQAQQASLFVATQSLPDGPGHPFYEKLNGLLARHGFDAHVEALCAPYYHDKLGRQSIAPGVYFRMLMIGYFEGLDSERGIAWRVADSLSLRQFLGHGLTERTPEHSSLTRIRQRLPVAVHEEVFRWVLQVLTREGLLRGQTVAVDATTLEANAAMRALVRRDSGLGYREYLQQLAREAGIAAPTRADEVRIDKGRPRKASNAEWQHLHDPEARVAKMKDGRTHLAHKLEQVVDLETEAVVAVRVAGADEGDTETIGATLAKAEEHLTAVASEPLVAERLAPQPLAEVVADKGYHSNDVLVALQAASRRTYVAEPQRGRRKWDGDRVAQAAVYANRRRLRGRRSRALQRRRAERAERPFAHALQTGALRRVFLRGRDNIYKRLCIHFGALDLGVAMRKLFGMGTPKGLAGLLRALLSALLAWVWLLRSCGHSWRAVIAIGCRSVCHRLPALRCPTAGQMAISSTGC